MTCISCPINTNTLMCNTSLTCQMSLGCFLTCMLCYTSANVLIGGEIEKNWPKKIRIIGRRKKETKRPWTWIEKIRIWYVSNSNIIQIVEKRKQFQVIEIYLFWIDVLYHFSFGSKYIIRTVLIHISWQTFFLFCSLKNFGVIHIMK